MAVYVWLNGNIGDIAWSDKWRHVNSFVWIQIYARISWHPDLIIFLSFKVGLCASIYGKCKWQFHKFFQGLTQ